MSLTVGSTFSGIGLWYNILMKTFSPEARKRMSDAAKARCTPEWRAAQSARMVTPLDLVTVKGMYNGGFTQTEIAAHLRVSQKVVWGFMKRNGIKSRVAAKRYQSGLKNNMWKGDVASYKSFHRRIGRLKGQPKCCQVCGTTDPTKSYDWANLTGKYEDPEDYERMCRSCHATHDGTINNIHHMRERFASD